MPRLKDPEQLRRALTVACSVSLCKAAIGELCNSIHNDDVAVKRYGHWVHDARWQRACHKIVPDSQPDHEVMNPVLQQVLVKLADIIKGATPEGYGFALLMFEQGDAPERALFYIADSERQGICNAMREFIRRYGAQ